MLGLGFCYMKGFIINLHILLCKNTFIVIFRIPARHIYIEFNAFVFVFKSPSITK